MGRFLDDEPVSGYRGKFLDEAPVKSNIIKPSPLEERKVGREDVLSRSLSNFIPSYKKLIQQPSLENLGNVGLNNLGVLGGAGQRIEAAISNQVSRGQDDYRNMADIPGQFQASVKGLSGEQLGEFGDNAVKAGASEPLAKVLGFGTSVALDPLSALAGMKASKATQGLNKSFQKSAEGVMNYALGTPKAALKAGKNLGREALDRGVRGSLNKMLSGADAEIARSENLVNSMLQGRGEKVNGLQIASELDNLIKPLQLGGDEAGVRAIQKVQDAILAQVDNAGNLAVDKAHELKLAFNKILGDKGFALREPSSAILARRVASGKLAGGIESAVPNLRDASGRTVGTINKDLGFNYRLADSLEGKAASLAGKSPLDLVDAIALVGQNPTLMGADVLRKVMGTRPVQTNLARFLNAVGSSGFPSGVASGASQVGIKSLIDLLSKSTR